MTPNQLAKALIDKLEQEEFYGSVTYLFEKGKVVIADEHNKMKEDRLLKRISR